MIPTILTNLAIGTITTGLATIMALSTWISGSQVIQGNLFWDTTSNPNPKEYVGTTLVRTMSGGFITENIPTRRQLYGSLALTEEAGTASGVQIITNPIDDYLICDDIIFNVETTASPTTGADIFFATGTTIASLSATGSDIYDNFDFATGLVTMSGSALVDAQRAGGRFILAPSSSTTENKSIAIVSTNGTGANLVGTYDIPCRYLKD